MVRKILHSLLVMSIILSLGACSNDEFLPQDVSDKTIESISTYGDYITMYQYIITDYYDYYESQMKDTILWSEEAFSELKSTHDDSYQQLKSTYESLWDSKIIGKDKVVEMLISQRDSLRAVVDKMVEGINKIS